MRDGGSDPDSVCLRKTEEMAFKPTPGGRGWVQQRGVPGVPVLGIAWPWPWGREWSRKPWLWAETPG